MDSLRVRPLQKRPAAAAVARTRAPTFATLEESMEAFQHGHSGGFERVFRTLAPKVASVIGFHLKDARLAEDLTQEVFLKVHRHRDAYQRGMPVAPWIFAIARNVMLDHARSTRRKNESLSENGTLPELSSESVETSSACGASLVLDELVAELPPVQREAVVLLKVHDLSLAEAAALCNTSIATIKMRAHRAYRALRIQLEKRATRDL